ncbi:MULTISPECIES: metallophosphoesterase family protein [unclassified Bacillus (in: firmicutes)]|uniref:metallophosphoesterase family protein n=1 Tax=unclassified Bacillus (in: firmicutes) TaxID=185979 RepID=UPI00047E03F3|nr:MULTISPECIES: metallophosphoesterase family protein [unclassified Bacillus (in: firmicutes)]SDZ22656.1 serine/threonine protein phosphatase 1 [Bacillus sp. 166amftsu]
MQRFLVISDIHGEIEKFEKLLVEAQYNAKQDQLILLGDYVDRGPNAKAVIEKVMELKEEGAFVLKGNHEDMMIKALTTDEEQLWDHWVKRNGGNKTLYSYNFSENDIATDEEEFKKPNLKSEILEKHLQFIQKLEHYIETEQYIFVHAGVEPTKPVSESEPYTLMWIRNEFHSGYNGEKTVVFGHTETKTLHGDDNCDVYFGNNRIIGIDGGAVYGGQLNCLELPSQIVYAVKE